MAGSDNEIIVKLTAEQAQLQAGMEQGAASVASATDAMKASVADATASMGASQDAMQASVAAEAAAFNAAVQTKIDAQVRLNAAFSGGLQGAAAITEAESALDEAMATGAITAAEYAAYIDVLNASELAAAEAATVDTVAVAANTEAKVLNARVSGELGTMLGEVLSGNFGRLRRSAGALANQSGLLAKAFTPVGIAALLAGGAVLAFADAVIKGSEEQSKFDNALIMTNDAAGVTSSTIQSMAEQVGESTGSFGKASDALLIIAKSGRFTADELRTVGTAAVQMSDLTGESVDKSVEAFAKLQEKPVQAVAKLNDQYHFLTQAVFDQITALQQQGNTQGAAKLAMETYAAALQQRTTEAEAQLGTLARAWDSVKHSASFAWDAMLGVGRTETIDDKIARLQAQLVVESGTHLGQARPLARFNEKAGHVGWESTGEDPAVAIQIAQLKALQAAKAIADKGAADKGAQDAQVAAHADAVAKVIDKHHALAHAATASGDAEAKASQMAMNGLSMQRLGTEQDTAQRIQADAAILASATKLYGADSSQQVAALRQMLADEQSYDHSIVKARETAYKQIEAAKKKNDAAIKKAEEVAAKSAHDTWTKVLGPINNAFNQSIQGMIQGTQTFKQMTANLLRSIVASYAQTGLQILTDHIIKEQAKTAATAAGAAERATIEAAAAAQSKASDAATGKSQITSAAATGAAKAYQAIVGIPYVGPILAPIAAGVAFAGIEAFSGMISSAEGGWGRVPMDGMMTELHKNEMVLPAPIADHVRNTMGGNGGGGMTVNLSSTDPRGFKEYLRRNPAALSDALKHAHKRGHFAGATR